jgi:hypothetical protein
MLSQDQLDTLRHLHREAQLALWNLESCITLAGANHDHALHVKGAIRYTDKAQDRLNKINALLGKITTT